MSSTTAASIDALRVKLVTQVNAACDAAIAKLGDGTQSTTIDYKMPTQADGHDPRNKNSQNLTPRGIEIIYRVFDDGGGYNRAAKMLNISQGAAKNRKAIWTKLGGPDRVKQIIDIDGV